MKLFTVYIAMAKSWCCQLQVQCDVFNQLGILVLLFDYHTLNEHTDMIILCIISRFKLMAPKHKYQVNKYLMICWQGEIIEAWYIQIQ